MQSRSEGQLPATPGMPLTWVQETARPFFRPGPSMAFNHDRLIDSRGDSAGERKVSLFPPMVQPWASPVGTPQAITATSLLQGAELMPGDG